MSYTTKQRNKIYKKAYKLLHNGEEFMCHALNIATGGLRNRFETSQIIEMFPEFALFAPYKNIDRNLGVWEFDNTVSMSHENEFAPRRTVIAFCISMTEENSEI